DDEAWRHDWQVPTLGDPTCRRRATFAPQELRRRRPDPPLRNGLGIAGHFMSEIGLGQAARNLAHACETQRLPLSFYNLPLPARDNEQEFATNASQSTTARCSCW